MKRHLCVVSLGLLLCVAIGCQNKAEKAELEKLRAQAALEEQNKALVKAYFEAWNRQNYDAIKEMTVPEFTRYFPSRIIEIRSLEELIEYRKAVQTSYPDCAWSIEELYADGDRVIERFTFRGTSQGKSAGTPSPGNKVELSGMEIWRIENRKVVEIWVEADMLGLYQQLGMELRPKEVN